MSQNSADMYSDSNDGSDNGSQCAMKNIHTMDQDEDSADGREANTKNCSRSRTSTSSSSKYSERIRAIMQGDDEGDDDNADFQEFASIVRSFKMNEMLESDAIVQLTHMIRRKVDDVILGLNAYLSDGYEIVKVGKKGGGDGDEYSDVNIADVNGYGYQLFYKTPTTDDDHLIPLIASDVRIQHMVRQLKEYKLLLNRRRSCESSQRQRQINPSHRRSNSWNGRNINVPSKSMNVNWKKRGSTCTQDSRDTQINSCPGSWQHESTTRAERELRKYRSNSLSQETKIEKNKKGFRNCTTEKGQEQKDNIFDAKGKTDGQDTNIDTQINSRRGFQQHGSTTRVNEDLRKYRSSSLSQEAKAEKNRKDCFDARDKDQKLKGNVFDGRDDEDDGHIMTPPPDENKHGSSISNCGVGGEVSKGQERFNQLFEERMKKLRLFKRKYGHVNVKQKYDPSLYYALYEYRISVTRPGHRQARPLNAYQIQTLKDIGMKFDNNNSTTSSPSSSSSTAITTAHQNNHNVNIQSDRCRRNIQSKIEQLRAFKEKHGHLNVSYKDEALYKFCYNVRNHGASSLPKSKTNTLTQDQIQSLRDLGFELDEEEIIHQSKSSGTNNDETGAGITVARDNDDGSGKVPASVSVTYKDTTTMPFSERKGTSDVGSDDDFDDGNNVTRTVATGSSSRASFNDINFERRLKQLQAYKLKHGHVNVRKKDNLGLYNACYRYRVSVSRPGLKCDRHLSEYQLQKLKDLGLDFNIKPKSSLCKSSQSQLNIQHNTIDFELDSHRTHSFSPSSVSFNDKNLEGENADEGESTTTRIGLGREVEKVQDHKRQKHSSVGFDQRVEQLRAFRKAHGHLNIRRKGDKALHNFCYCVKKYQSQSFPVTKASALTEKQIQALRSIGLEIHTETDSPLSSTERDLSVSPKKNPMTSILTFDKVNAKHFRRNVEKLKAFKRKHGHLRVKQKDDWTLQKFCVKMRKSLAAKNLTEDQFQILKEIGFIEHQQTQLPTVGHLLRILYKEKGMFNGDSEELWTIAHVLERKRIYGDSVKCQLTIKYPDNEYDIVEYPHADIERIVNVDSSSVYKTIDGLNPGSIAYDKNPSCLMVGDHVECLHQNGKFQGRWWAGRIASTSTDGKRVDVAYFDGEYEKNVPLRKGVIHLIGRGGPDANKWLVGAEFAEEAENDVEKDIKTSTCTHMVTKQKKNSKVLRVSVKRGQTRADSCGTIDDLCCVVERPDGSQEDIPYNDIVRTLFTLKRKQASNLTSWPVAMAEE